MSTLSIRVRDLHLEYEIFSERRAALRQRLITGQGSGKSVVHALKGVSFDAHRGEAIGVIGSNGSGKSTLLAALAGLLPQTSGQILVSAEPKLLGVGAALIPGASGLRNVRLGCLALGMTLDEVEDCLPGIIEFTELGEALNRPLKTYSSGMRARLHFAISTAVTPEILLIDEALAVGDDRFRQKSQTRIDKMLAEAGTLLIVSHSMEEIKRTCSRVIWIETGHLRGDGAPAEIVAEYATANRK